MSAWPPYPTPLTAVAPAGHSDDPATARRHFGMKPDGRGGQAATLWQRPDASASQQIICLEAGELFPWHRATVTVVVQPISAAPLVVTISPNGHDAAAQHVGLAWAQGQLPTLLIPAGHWWTTEPLGAHSIFTLTATPAMTPGTIELAPDHWRPMPRGG